MKDQHTKIKGYRDLTQEEIDLMNEVKVKGAELEALIEKLKALQSNDQKWIEVGELQLKQGIMSLVRAVAQPTSF
jgi:predicted nuclease with TOPRIM domain